MFDLTAACSDFLFGLVVAGQFLQGGAWCDGGGQHAAARAGGWGQRAGPVGGLGGPELVHPVRGRGRGHGADSGRGGGGEREEGPKTISTPGEGTVVQDGSYDLMSMNGQKVYSFATREVPKVIPRRRLTKPG